MSRQSLLPSNQSRRTRHEYLIRADREVSQGDFRRADVMSWLTGCPIRPAGARATGINPSRWGSLTRKAGIVRGMEQWRDRLNLYAERLSEDAARLAGAEETTEARAERMKSEAAAAREALAFIEKLAEDVEPPVNRSTWGAFCRWADELLDRYLDRDIPDAEVAVLEKIRLALEELEAAVSINPGATLDEFRQTVEDWLGRTVGHLGVTGRGVFVSPVGGAAGMSFDRVWLVGMIEGGMPPPVRPDPLLPEPDWQAAGGHSRFAQRVAAERCDYLSAVATSPHRELSTTRRNTRSLAPMKRPWPTATTTICTGSCGGDTLGAGCSTTPLRRTKHSRAQRV